MPAIQTTIAGAYSRASDRTLQLQCWLALTCFTVVTRLPSLLHRGPIDDEAVYAVVANVMLHGGIPYADAIERKPPLLFGVYWATFRLFGPYNWLALHLVALAWILLTMAGLFVTANRLFGWRAGVFAALSYSAFQNWGPAKNLAFNGEMLMNLPLVWAYALVLGRQSMARWPWAPFIAGVLLAIAFLLKQPAAIAAVPLGLYLLPTPGQSRTGNLAARFGEAALLTAGFAITLSACALLLWWRGILADGFYWTVTDHTVPHIFWTRALEHTALFMGLALPLILPLMSRRALLRAWRRHPAELQAVLRLAAVSAIGAAAGGRFYPHYYIQLVPPLAILAAATYDHALENRGSPSTRWLSPRFAAACLALVTGLTLVVQTAQLMRQTTPSAAARFVRSHSQETDRVFVWGQSTVMYIDMERLPASRYIATFPLTGYIFGGQLPGVSTTDRIVPDAWPHLATDFQDHPPRFLIDTQAGAGAAYPIANFPYLATLIAGNYRRVARLPDGDVYQRCEVPGCGDAAGRTNAP